MNIQPPRSRSAGDHRRSAYVVSARVCRSRIVLVTAMLLFLIGLCVPETNAVPQEAAKVSTIVADAAQAKDWTKVKELATQSEPAEINAAQADGMTALHWAVLHDEQEVARHLVARGASVKLANRYEVTPLSTACVNGNDAIVQILLDAGADVNRSLAGGETPLMTASRTGRPAVVKRLLDRGADVNARERKGQTALMWAADEGHVDVVQALIGAGADREVELSSGFNALCFASRAGHTAVVEALINAGCDARRIKDEKSPRKGSIPLLLAVENGHFETAMFLVRAGADPNDQRSGFTPLHALTWVRKPNRGEGDDGDPAPQGSGRLSSLAFARELVQAGADVNARLEKGNHGTGVLTLQGATPLFMASMTADLEYVKLLLELGADRTVTNADNASALAAAAGLGALAPEETAGTEEEALEVVTFLIERGLDVNATDNNGETAMHGAAYKNFPRVVELLADRGADPASWNRKNKYGWTPLDIAEGRRPGNFKPSVATAEALRKIIPSNR